MRLCHLVALLSLGLCAPAVAQMSPPTNTTDWALRDNDWSTAKAGTALDLTGFSRVGPTDANLCDIAPLNKNTAGQGNHTWYAEENTGNSPSLTTPVYNVAPTPGTITRSDNTTYTGTNPYACPSGVLTITLSNPTGNQWQAGTIEMMSPYHDGFAPKFGYFEAKIKMPPPPTGMCPWASAWTNQNVPQANPANNGAKIPPYLEFDIFETCDVSPYTDSTALITTLHWWMGNAAKFWGGPGRTVHAQKQLAYTASLFDNQWHTYGAMFTSHYVIYYRDGVEQGRFPVLGRDMVNPIMALLDISHAGTITAATSASWTMSVQYARWWQCSPAYGCDR